MIGAAGAVSAYNTMQMLQNNKTVTKKHSDNALPNGCDQTVSGTGNQIPTIVVIHDRDCYGPMLAILFFATIAIFAFAVARCLCRSNTNG